jgi:hypothetical protein
MLRHLNRRGSKRDHLSAFNSVQFTMYYTFFFNVDDVVCQNNGQFQVWELNICDSSLLLLKLNIS